MIEPPGPIVAARPRTIVEKIWDTHRVRDQGGRTLLYADRILIADTALPAFDAVEAKGLRLRAASHALLTPDHFTPSDGTSLAEIRDPAKRSQVELLQERAERLGLTVFKLGDPRRGIQHVVAAEQGFALPATTVVAADSHTTTLGALGALAFSVGSDLAHVLATQCVWLKPPAMMRVTLNGQVADGVTAKDVALALIARFGTDAAHGHAVEYCGSYIVASSIEARMTLCNMAVEMGALMAIIAPDEKVFDYLAGRPHAPSAPHIDAARQLWAGIGSDAHVCYDRDLSFDVDGVAPMVTWGNSVDTAVAITGTVPDPSQLSAPDRRAQMLKSLDYMGLEPGMPLAGLAINQVFIGSCTNARIEDLRAAAAVLRGRAVVVPTLVVPGSGLVKQQAEAEGLDIIFMGAGARWGEAGCSMCVSMNGDIVQLGARCASTSNRNHMGRQGRGSRTHLLSPPMAAAAAVAGHLTDVRNLDRADHD